jgi:hypothetical protein
VQDKDVAADDNKDHIGFKNYTKKQKQKKELNVSCYCNIITEHLSV